MGEIIQFSPKRASRVKKHPRPATNKQQILDVLRQLQEMVESGRVIGLCFAAHLIDDDVGCGWSGLAARDRDIGIDDVVVLLCTMREHEPA